MSKHIHIHVGSKITSKVTDTGGDFWSSEFDNLKGMASRAISKIEASERMAKEVRSTVSRVDSELRSVRKVWEKSPDAPSFANHPQGGKKLTEIRNSLGNLLDKLR